MVAVAAAVLMRDVLVALAGLRRVLIGVIHIHARQRGSHLDADRPLRGMRDRRSADRQQRKRTKHQGEQTDHRNAALSFRGRVVICKVRADEVDIAYHIADGSELGHRHFELTLGTINILAKGLNSFRIDARCISSSSFI